MSEGVEGPIDASEEIGSAPGEKEQPEGLELVLSQVNRLSQLIQQEYGAQEPHSPEEEQEFQTYMRKWVAEYQRLAQAGPQHQAEALEILGMIRVLLGDLPIEDGLLPQNVYDNLLSENPTEI